MNLCGERDMEEILMIHLITSYETSHCGTQITLKSHTAHTLHVYKMKFCRVLELYTLDSRHSWLNGNSGKASTYEH